MTVDTLKMQDLGNQQYTYTRAVSGGVSGGSAEPPLQINDIHDYCYAFEKLRAEMYILYNTPTFYAHSTLS